MERYIHIFTYSFIFMLILIFIPIFIFTLTSIYIYVGAMLDGITVLMFILPGLTCMCVIRLLIREGDAFSCQLLRVFVAHLFNSYLAHVSPGVAACAASIAALQDGNRLGSSVQRKKVRFRTRIACTCARCCHRSLRAGPWRKSDSTLYHHLRGPRATCASVGSALQELFRDCLRIR